MKRRIFSGMRPTGRLHLGHLVGALKNWVALQDQYECIFGIVDWHALMGEYEQSKSIRENIMEMAIDWMACGIDFEKSTIFIQSHVPEHVELQMIFSCITPLGWLERNPTYKEQLREIRSRDLQTYAFLGYPVLQAADILLYQATAVPIGEDQLPHIELTREIARRFNHIYRTEFFKNCEAILTENPRLLGLDGRKMSKSYQNTINLSDSQLEVEKKVKRMITDPQRVRLKDPGHPDKCNVYSYYKVFCLEMSHEVCVWCSNAQKGCTECKLILAEKIEEVLQPIRERRKQLSSDKDQILRILDLGRKKARDKAAETINMVRKIVF